MLCIKQGRGILKRTEKILLRKLTSKQNATDKVQPYQPEIQKYQNIKREGIYLKESGEHVERVNSRGTICIRQHLVDMATPSIFLIVIGNRLECCQDSREKRRRGRRGLNLWEAVCVTFILTETHTQGPISYNPTCSTLPSVFTEGQI